MRDDSIWRVLTAVVLIAAAIAGFAFISLVPNAPV
jgi:hypothetical protein